MTVYPFIVSGNINAESEDEGMDLLQLTLEDIHCDLKSLNVGNVQVVNP